VPVNLVKKIVKDIKEFGMVQRAVLGVRIDAVSSQRAEALGLPYVGGVYISSVTPKGGADEAGLEAKDVIIGINGKKIKTIPEMQELIGRYRPGNSIEVEYFKYRFCRKRSAQRVGLRTPRLDQERAKHLQIRRRLCGVSLSR